MSLTRLEVYRLRPATLRGNGTVSVTANTLGARIKRTRVAGSTPAPFPKLKPDGPYKMRRRGDAG